jgi:hypothetical protein
MKTVKGGGGHIAAWPATWPHTHRPKAPVQDPPPQPSLRAAAKGRPAAAVIVSHGLCPAGIRRRQEGSWGGRRLGLGEGGGGAREELGREPSTKRTFLALDALDWPRLYQSTLDLMAFDFRDLATWRAVNLRPSNFPHVKHVKKKNSAERFLLNEICGHCKAQTDAYVVLVLVVSFRSVHGAGQK